MNPYQWPGTRHTSSALAVLISALILGLLIVDRALAGNEPDSTEKKAGQLSVATCQFPVSGDISENGRWIRKQIRQAHEMEADIPHFPEAALSGYAGVDHGNLDGFDWEMQRRELEAILDLARSLRVWVILGAAHRLNEGHKPHNSLYVIDDKGAVVDRYDKRFCTSGDLRHYSPGDQFVTFDIHGVRCGLLICYDVRFPELYRQYHVLGARLVLQSFYNARQKPGSIHPKIMPPTVQARAATNDMFISISNSCAPHSWQSIFVTPDGLISDELLLDEAGVMVNLVDTEKSYYDASRPYRMDSIQGKWNSGEVVDDPRSKDRQSY
jgi:predicted amidohydrolase